MALVLFVDTYVTLDRANEVLTVRSPSWANANTLLKEQALAKATSILDTEPWIGQAVSADQPLSWPRKGVSFFDPSSGRWTSVPNDSIPKLLETVVLEQADHLVVNPGLLASTQVSGIQSISLGPLSITNSEKGTSSSTVSQRPTKLRRLLSPLLRNKGARDLWWRAN